jgi:hypothetical protein
MIIAWPSVAAGFVPGAVLGGVIAWKLAERLRKSSELRALNKEYSSLSGEYQTFRVRDDGTHEPTGGKVEIAWQPREGMLEASSFQAAGHPEWHSYIRMSREFPGSGLGHYNNSNSIHGGIQQISYSKQTRSFYAMGTSQGRIKFSQYWKARE